MSLDTLDTLDITSITDLSSPHSVRRSHLQLVVQYLTFLVGFDDKAGAQSPSNQTHGRNCPESGTGSNPSACSRTGRVRKITTF